MKQSTTYPTKHPHWIDESDSSNATKKRKRIGISFKIAVAVVMAIHLAVIGGIYAYTSLKPKISPIKASANVSAQNPTGPKSDALAGNAWPQHEGKPRVVAVPAPTRKKEVALKPSARPKAAVVESPKGQPAEKTDRVAASPKTPAPMQDTRDEAIRKAFLAARSSKPTAEQPHRVEHSSSILQATPPTPEVLATTTVTIPHTAASDQSKVAATPARKSTDHATRVGEYTLGAGDNLYLVARKLGVSFSDLARENGINDPRQLRVGQTLKVPSIASL